MTGLEALEKYRGQQQGVNVDADNLLNIVEKDLKALNEIFALHDNWLGNVMSDYEFFVLLNEIRFIGFIRRKLNGFKVE